MSILVEEEVPLIDQQDSTGSKPRAFIAGKTQLRSYNKSKISLDATKFRVLLELEGNGDEDDTPEVDIVTVLDISGSMGDDNKIDKLKNAMQFLIKKLSSNHRLSVVTFSSTATRRSHLRRMTEQGQKEVEDIVKSLPARGGTNIADGLRLGLKTLEERRQTRGRVAAIMLMSDGDQGRKYEDARDVPVAKFPVYTFGFGKGKDYNPEVLEAVAGKSNGGTFSVADVDNTQTSNLTAAFTISLGGLLTTVVQGLELIVERAKPEITISRVPIKLYPIKVDDDSRTISFGHLYTGEKRKVLVELDLPKSTNEAGYEVLHIDYSFDYEGEPFLANTVTISVFRTNGPLDAENPEVATEGTRNNTVDKMQNATNKADVGDFGGAQTELGEARALLEEAAVNFVIEVLKSQVALLSELLQNKDIYKDKGRHIARALLASHNRQRMTAIGDDPLKDGLFDTPTLKTLVQQAVDFVLNPNLPIEPFLTPEPPAPVPEQTPAPPPVVPEPTPAPPPVVPEPTPEPSRDVTELIPEPPAPDTYAEYVKKVLAPVIALLAAAFEWLSQFGKVIKRD